MKSRKHFWCRALSKPRARVTMALALVALSCSAPADPIPAPVCAIRSGPACYSTETQVGCWGDPTQALLESAMHGPAECREPAGSDGSVWCCVPVGHK